VTADDEVDDEARAPVTLLATDDRVVVEVVDAVDAVDESAVPLLADCALSTLNAL